MNSEMRINKFELTEGVGVAHWDQIFFRTSKLAKGAVTRVNHMSLENL